MAVWYIQKNGQKYGPVNVAQLKDLARTGRLLPSDLIWREGLPNWVPASNANGLEFGSAQTSLLPGNGSNSDHASRGEPATVAGAPTTPAAPTVTPPTPPQATPALLRSPTPQGNQGNFFSKIPMPAYLSAGGAVLTLVILGLVLAFGGDDSSKKQASETTWRRDSMEKMPADYPEVADRKVADQKVFAPSPPWREKSKVIPRAKTNSDKVRMEIYFMPGRYAISEDLDIDLTMRIQGQSIPMNIETLTEGEVRIAKPDAIGDQNLFFRCDRMKQVVKAAGRTLRYDSNASRSQSPELARMLKPLVGWEGKLKVDSNGKFKELDGITSLMERATSAGLAGKERQQLKAMMEQLMKNLLTNAWGKMIPKYPVAVGDEWRAKISLPSNPMLGDMEADAKCKLLRVEQTGAGPVAVMEYDMDLNIGSKKIDMSKMGGAAGNVLLRNFSSKAKGIVGFNMDIGLSTRLKMTADGQGTMIIEVPGGGKQTVNLSIKQKYTTFLKALDKNR